MNTERKNKEEWGVVGFWGPVFESVWWLGPHVHICMCESAFLLLASVVIVGSPRGRY